MRHPPQRIARLPDKCNHVQGLDDAPADRVRPRHHQEPRPNPPLQSFQPPKMKPTSLRTVPAVAAVVGLLAALPASGEGPTENTNTSALTGITIEELMQVEVTSVSKRPEALVGAASAIDVITE